MIKEHITKKAQGSLLTTICLAINLLAASVGINAGEMVEEQVPSAQTDKTYSFS